MGHSIGLGRGPGSLASGQAFSQNWTGWGSPYIGDQLVLSRLGPWKGPLRCQERLSELKYNVRQEGGIRAAPAAPPKGGSDPRSQAALPRPQPALLSPQGDAALTSICMFLHLGAHSPLNRHLALPLNWHMLVPGGIFIHTDTACCAPAVWAPLDRRCWVGRRH